MPSTDVPEGISIETCLPTFASLCLLGSSATVTTSWVELVVSTGVAAAAVPVSRRTAVIVIRRCSRGAQLRIGCLELRGLGS